MIRRSTLTSCVLVLLVITSASVAAAGVTTADAYDDGYGPGASEMAAFNPFGPNAGDDVARYGGSQTPSAYVTYQNESFSSLESWANFSDDRRVLSHDADAQRALVTAPAGQLGLTPISKLLDRGLASKSYIERISLNLNVDYAEPVPLGDSSEFSRPVPNQLVSGGWSSDGVAFAGDAPQASPDDVRSVIGGDVSATGAGVTVGICDTGINTDAGTVYGNGTRGSTSRVVSAHNFITGEGATAANGFENVSDGNGHGSWVASSIGANVTDASYDGMAPDADLVIGKALNDDGEATTEQIANCIEYMEEQDTDVLSLSVGSPLYSATIAEELDAYLAGNGTVTMVAAGNARMRPAGGRYVNSPADTPTDGVLTVAATNAVAAENATSAYFSSVGPDASRDLSNGVTAGQGIDLAAPGMNTTVRTVTESGAHQNMTLSGTSMATPYVAGSTALYLDANPNRVNDTNATAGYLRNTTTVMPNAGTTEVGQGMVNVSQLIAEDPSTETQANARTEDAQASDAANEGYSGAWWFRAIGV